jgi:hypothetical protein
MAKARTPIPAATAARVLFASNRTCCVCRQAGRPIQIHHIDENPTNHDEHNLAVLCFECHEETQRTGGFARRLDRAQVLLYRDNWLQTVAAERSTSHLDDRLHRTPENLYDAQLVTSLVEINRNAENWVNLAFLYDGISNEELRDEAVDKATAAGASDGVLLMLRRMQGRLGEVPKDMIDSELERLKDNYRERSLLLEDLGRYREAAEEHLQGLAEDVPRLKNFTLAHHLAELANSGIIEGLFFQSLQEAAERDDLWWQVRALQELGWQSELDELVLGHEGELATREDLSDDMRAMLRAIAARARGDDDAAREAIKESERISADESWEDS